MKLRAISTEEFEAATGVKSRALELGAQIWELRKAGVAPEKVARQLGIDFPMLDEALASYEKALWPQVNRVVEHYQALDCARLEEIIGRYLPQTLAEKVLVQRTNAKGDTYQEENFELPQKAAAIVLKAIESRLKLLGISEGTGGAGAQAAPQNILVWLQQALPSVEKLVANPNRDIETPGEVLELESLMENEESPIGD